MTHQVDLPVSIYEFGLPAEPRQEVKGVLRYDTKEDVDDDCNNDRVDDEPRLTVTKKLLRALYGRHAVTVLSEILEELPAKAKKKSKYLIKTLPTLEAFQSMSVVRFTLTVSEHLNNVMSEFEALAKELELRSDGMSTSLEFRVLARAVGKGQVELACLAFWNIRDARGDVGQWLVNYLPIQVRNLSTRRGNAIRRLQAVVDVLEKAPIDSGIGYLIAVLDEVISDAEEMDLSDSGSGH